MKKVRIGAGQGFYGDTVYGALNMAKYGNVQYISFDTLAELTMAILQKDKEKDPNKGYAKDITTTLETLLTFVKEKKIKLITNAGGVNPLGARFEAERVAKKLGITGIRIGIATGDNIYPYLTEWEAKGYLKNYDDEEVDFAKIKDQLLFASAYLGAKPIVEALKQGADIVLTGRTTDTAQFLAPLMYEFNWQEDDWDKLALGILVGHLMECSAQSTGGNFSGDWWNIEDFDNIGYPLAEVYEDGRVIITKPEGTGGRVSVDTVKEQLLYEIHDPTSYITPDVIADFSQVKLTQIGPDQVEVSGVKGRPAPSTLKGVIGYKNGYLGQGTVGYSWPDALAKAKKVEEIIRKQIVRYGIEAEDVLAEYIGINSIHGALAAPIPTDELNEVYLRMAIKTKTKEEATRFGKLFPPLALNGPPFIGGLSNMSSVRELSGLWSVLLPRELVEQNIVVEVTEVK